MANQASGASSSSCSNSTIYPYFDVFINHRGPDVKNTFAAHLYRRLLDHGLQVFLDKPELLEGHPITSQICAAIEVASLHIAIFSPTYAESKWCLDELLLMLKSKATILPVFYKVKPYQLRWDGAYAEALRGLEQKKSVDAQTGEEKPRYDSNTIRSWRDALSKAADISGFELQGDEEELLTRVVQRALKIVSKPPLYVAKYPTGVDDKLQDFEATVMQQHEHRASARVVGIVGFGGIGKTTLAKTFFNSKKSYYSESSFLFDVRETSAKFSLGYLQSKLIEDLKHINIKIENPDEGVGILGRYLSSCQALVILDDVDSVNQLEVLLPIKEILSPESLILITSRDKRVLKSSGVLESSIYSLKGLNTKHSKELFCSYAFYQPLPPRQEFEGLVDRFVTACDGLPLSLKVVGALVSGEEDEVYWEEQLDLLQQTLPSEIQERLRISYDSLTEKDQEIFLDIACFFLGEERDKAIRIWGLVGLRNLENKCLLEVDSESKIRMHDHIRDCARNIAEKGSMSRRLWHRHRTNILKDLLELTQSGVTGVRGITMATYPDFFRLKDWEREVYYMSSAVPPNPITNGVDPLNNSHFRGSRNLQLVAAKSSDLEIILRWAQPPHLLWLRWNECYDSSLPAWIPMENLRVLEVLGPKLNSLWPHQSQGPLQLRELNICAPLSEFPKSIGQLQHLERIVVCAKKLSVEFLPEDFGRLCSLKYLVLKNFSKMMSLPDSFGKLTNLRHIDLGGASSLQMLPNSFGDLSRLEHLSLARARAIKLLPDCFGKLTNLRHIDLRRASSLQMLPNSFGDLSRLEHLSLEKCFSLTISSGALGNITTLEYLNLEWCSNLKELAPQIARQLSLKNLLMESTELKELQCFIGDLCNLEVLHIRSPPWVRYSERLEELQVPHSPKLKCLPVSFGHFTQMTELWLVGCRIEYLPQGLLYLNNLRKLEVVDCPLREFPIKPDEGEAEGGKAWNQLESLVLKGAKMSEVAFPKGVCPNLHTLDMDNCQELRGIQGLCDLSKLVYLSIRDCVKVEDLESLENLRSLDHVMFSGCRRLKIIQGLGQLTKLEVLDVRGCHEMVGLPGVEQCMRLLHLDACDCPKLQWGGGVLQQLRHRSFLSYENLVMDAIPYKRRKLRGDS